MLLIVLLRHQRIPSHRHLLRLLCIKPMVYSRPRDSSSRHSYDLTTSLFTPHQLHHGIPHCKCLTGRHQTMGRRSSDSTQRYWCLLAENNLLNVELTSHLVNAYKVTRSDLGVSLLCTIRPSSRSFVRFFVHPSPAQVTICNGSKCFIFIHSFQL